ncbi:LacI family DNA-binding transcriptional regulator [Streptomyces sp. JJ36]|uniref:LacI family DNA-binding transcriptional regulator n=1 Tax=Streptomyces sp. JJ36 TaxID=2736645 RepID=UPI001F33ED02|nr:LacI family DNA-binding transcriptional regulator [Streptomyces sp. JJ36]MCF6525885.1 LacI family DNA-binding transcriptional regulator [Streptomyces sp. JJ36]
MPATIIDVAQRAGLSTATVSRALRGLPNVSESARARVLRAAEELSYTVSPVASQLSSGRTGAVGVVAPFLNRWFYGQVVVGIDSVLRAHDLDLLLYNLGDARVHQRFFERLPVRRRVDALIVLTLPLSGPEAEALASLEVPVTVLGDPRPCFWNVRIEDTEGAKTAVRHLINLGHRRIGMISGAAHPRGFSCPLYRREAYRAALAEAGLPHDPRLEAAGYFGIEDGAAAMAHLLSLSDPPTAVFAECDEMAFGALRTVRRMGLRCPEDVSVVGFDDHEMAHLMDLTTVAQPVVEQGSSLARQMLDALSGDCEEAHERVLPTRLIVRGTSGVVVPDDRRAAPA